MRNRLPLDIDAGVLAGAFATVFAAAVGAVRGVAPGQVTGFSLAALAGVFGLAGFVVGSVIAGVPDFGPTRRAALLRGFVATIPVYGCGGLLFLGPERWFTLLPLTSVVAAASAPLSRSGLLHERCCWYATRAATFNSPYLRLTAWPFGSPKPVPLCGC